MVPKVLTLLLIILLCLAPAGCWDRRDPELLAIVIALAFDYDAERELHHLIVQIANPRQMGEGGGEGGGGGEQNLFWVLSAYGQTPFEAMKNLAAGSSRELFWAHNRIVLFSEKAARQGIGDILDVVERERQLRATARPAVVQGDIRSLMGAQFPLEETGARGLDRQMVTIQLGQSVFVTQFINDLYSMYEMPGQELFIGKVEVLAGTAENESEAGDETGNGAGDASGQSGAGNPHPPPAIKIGGGALFREQKMSGWADDDQTAGWLAATGQAERFVLLTECPNDADSLLSVEIFKIDSEMRPVVEKGVYRVAIEVRARGRIQNYLCAETGEGGSLTTETEYILSLERRLAQAIRNRIKSAVERSQELESDIFGFGNLLYRKHPRLWEQVADRWDELYSGLAVDVNVEMNIERTGLITQPARSR